jgi:hypothetical protein
MEKRLPVPNLIAIVVVVMAATLGLLLLMASLANAPIQAAPLRSGTGDDPRIEAITATSSLPISDTYPGDGVDKTLYYNNAVAGTITLTLEISGTPTLTLTAGAAFDEPEHIYTSPVASAFLVVTHTVATTHTTQSHVAYTIVNTNAEQTVVAITYVQDVDAPSVLTPSIDTQGSQYLYAVNTALYYTNQMAIPQSFYMNGYSLDGLSGIEKVTFSPALGESPGDDTSGFWPWGPPWPGYGVDPHTTATGVITATVHDNVDNIAVQTYTYELDGTPPASTASAPLCASSSPVAVMWVATDTQSGIYSTTLWYTKEAAGTWSCFQAVNAGSGTFDFIPPEGDGAYLFATIAVDNLGNLEVGPTVSETQTLYDATPPTNVIITAPAYTVEDRFTVSWSADDATSGIASYTVEYSATHCASWQAWLPVTTTTSATFTAPYTPTVYVFRVTAYDQAGNSADAIATTRVGIFPVYLPLVMNHWVWWYQYDLYEPNDSPAQALAHSPLTSTQAYTAYIWDATDPDDYYHFTPITTDPVQVTLRSIPANCDYDLYIYYCDAQQCYLVAQSDESGNTNESLTFNPVVDTRYYIRVYPRSGSSNQQPYRLRVTYE